jgi:hypothetical protein
MNDEQQLWRDVQKFMNQFPGFVAIAKKIGEIGDLAAWQASEQRKLEAITLEIEKQRAAIVSEREAVNAEAARKLQESEAKLLEHVERMNRATSAAQAQSAGLIESANARAAQVIAKATAEAKKIADVVEPKKAALEDEIAALTEKVLSIKGEHAEITDALTKVKDDHASFLKKILGG